MFRLIKLICTVNTTLSGVCCIKPVQTQPAWLHQVSRAYCMTEFLCGCGSWLCPAAWRTTSMHLLHLATGSCWTASDLIVWAMKEFITWQTPNLLIQHCKQHQLHFLGHILRMPEEKPWRYALYVSTHGRRRPAQQWTSYLSYLQKPIGDAENDLRCNCLISCRFVKWLTFCFIRVFWVSWIQIGCSMCIAYAGSMNDNYWSHLFSLFHIHRTILTYYISSAWNKLSLVA